MTNLRKNSIEVPIILQLNDALTAGERGHNLRHKRRPSMSGLKDHALAGLDSSCRPHQGVPPVITQRGQ